MKKVILMCVGVFLLLPKEASSSFIASLPGRGMQYAQSQIDQALFDYYKDTIVDAFYLILMPPSCIIYHKRTFDLFTSHKEAKEEKDFRDKARFISMRKNIMEKLQKQIPSIQNDAHRSILDTEYKLATDLFNKVDQYRDNRKSEKSELERYYTTVDRYEKEYQGSMSIRRSIDQIIEDRLVASIILFTKPDSQCSPQELAQKKVNQERRIEIGQKVMQKLKDNALDIASCVLFNNPRFVLLMSNVAALVLATAIVLDLKR